MKDSTNGQSNGWGGRTVQSILIVDDNKAAAQALADLLAVDGYKVNTAHEGDQAVALADQLEPDVIILDVDLPDKDGYEVARTLRKKNSRALLIALTGYYGRKEDKAKARSAGFDHHLTRPVLVTEIEKLFSPPR